MNEPTKIPLPTSILSILLWLAAKAREGGIKLVLNVSLTVGTTAVLLVAVGLPEAGVDTTPTKDDGPKIVVASEPKHDNCPAGWFGDIVADDAAHLAQSTCTKGAWTVYLSSDGRFAFAWDGVSPAFEYNSRAVKGWR